MSTQEREAMERLEALLSVIVPGDMTGEQVIDHMDRVVEARDAVLKNSRARHARSLQPITVEGLVAMGDLWQPGRSTHLCNRVSLDLPEVRIVVEFWGDGQIVWMVNGHSVHSMFAPDNMLRVHDLIERLSR